jgi:regulator of protease activity HflC (stomatin/prohibitin superfamily)
VIIALVVAPSVQIAYQWERAVVLLLGRFVGIRGPGLFFIIPILNRIPYLIDIRVITTYGTKKIRAVENILSIVVV